MGGCFPTEHSALQGACWAVPLSEPNSVFSILPGGENKTCENMRGLCVDRLLHLVVVWEAVNL